MASSATEAETSRSNPPAVAETSTEKQQLSPEDAEGSKKSKGLLQVPSRSSSQKNQSSPASTALSGATVSDARNSMDGRSKDSKGSFPGRHRNGSASSNQTGGDTEQSPGQSQPTSPTSPQKKKKSGGFLSFLGCCGVPDSANTVEGENVNAHKVDRLPQRPATAKSRTQTQEPTSTKPIDEKAPHQDANTPAAEEISPSGNSDQITAIAGRDLESKPTTSPAVTVEPPVENEAPPEIATEEEDVVMKDASTGDATDNIIASVPEEPTLRTIPPPPPGPAPPVASPLVPFTEASSSALEPQKAILPPLAPELKGRKCLVLDLDETLVHSSFKILHQADFTVPVEIEGNYHNVYVMKRPGVDEFMKRVGELYEIVVFTASVPKYGDPVLDRLDIHKVVHHRLFRESCYNHQGNYVKDLSQVGRDLKNTIIIDNSPTSYIFHPQHAVPISSWFSDAHDNELLDLIPVLEDLAGPNVTNVSLVLDVTL